MSTKFQTLSNTFEEDFKGKDITWVTFIGLTIVYDTISHRNLFWRRLTF